MVSSSLRSGAATGQLAAATRCPSCALATHLHFTRIFLPCAGPRGNAPSRRLQQTRGEAAVLNASGAAAGKRTRRSFSTTSIIWLSAQRAPASRRACCDGFRTGGAPLADTCTRHLLIFAFSYSRTCARARVPSAPAAGWRSGGRARGRGGARSLEQRIGPPPARRKPAAACLGACCPRCRCAPTATLAAAGKHACVSRRQRLQRQRRQLPLTPARLVCTGVRSPARQRLSWLAGTARAPS